MVPNRRNLNLRSSLSELTEVRSEQVKTILWSQLVQSIITYKKLSCLPTSLTFVLPQLNRKNYGTSLVKILKKVFQGNLFMFYGRKRRQEIMKKKRRNLGFKELHCQRQHCGANMVTNTILYYCNLIVFAVLNIEDFPVIFLTDFYNICWKQFLNFR